MTVTADHDDDDQADDGKPVTFGQFVRAQLAGDRMATAHAFAQRLTTTRPTTPTEESE